MSLKSKVNQKLKDINYTGEDFNPLYLKQKSKPENVMFRMQGPMRIEKPLSSEPKTQAR